MPVSSSSVPPELVSEGRGRGPSSGFGQPWRLLAAFVPDLQVTELHADAGYLAIGPRPWTTGHIEQ